MKPKEVRLRYVRANDGAEANAVRHKVFAGALYSVEANEMKQRSIAALATAVIDMLKGKSDRHDMGWAHATSRVGNDLDPATQVIVRKPSR